MSVFIFSLLTFLSLETLQAAIAPQTTLVEDRRYLLERPGRFKFVYDSHYFQLSDGQWWVNAQKNEKIEWSKGDDIQIQKENENKYWAYNKTKDVRIEVKRPFESEIANIYVYSHFYPHDYWDRPEYGGEWIHYNVLVLNDGTKLLATEGFIPEDWHIGDKVIFNNKGGGWGTGFNATYEGPVLYFSDGSNL